MGDSHDGWRSSAHRAGRRIGQPPQFGGPAQLTWETPSGRCRRCHGPSNPGAELGAHQRTAGNTDYSNFADSVDGRAKVCDAGKSSSQVGVLDRKARVGQMTSIAMRMKVGTAAGAIALAASLPAVAPVSAAPVPVPMTPIQVLDLKDSPLDFFGSGVLWPWKHGITTARNLSTWNPGNFFQFRSSHVCHSE